MKTQLSHPASKSGITLVETLLALALSAIFMAATLHVTMRIAKLADSMENREVVSLAGAQNVIIMDMANADAIRHVDTGLQLRTRRWLDPRGNRMHHLPCRVAYHVDQINGRHWLFRSQSMGNSRSFSPILPDVTDILVETVSKEDTIPTDWSPIQDALTLKLTIQKDGINSCHAFPFRTR